MMKTLDCCYPILVHVHLPQLGEAWCEMSEWCKSIYSNIQDETLGVIIPTGHKHQLFISHPWSVFKLLALVWLKKTFICHHQVWVPDWSMCFQWMHVLYVEAENSRKNVSGNAKTWKFQKRRTEMCIYDLFIENGCLNVCCWRQWEQTLTVVKRMEESRFV